MKQKRTFRTCVWCNQDTRGEDIHQCELMPQKLPVPSARRHTDRPQRQSDAWIVHAGWVCIVIGMLGLLMLSIGDAKKDKRIYMMESSINRLTHELGNCRIRTSLD